MQLVKKSSRSTGALGYGEPTKYLDNKKEVLRSINHTLVRG
ncbi:MAG: hypothetical protein ACI8RP_000568 [Urechidicola sp.]|jgi:hypothetical protein